MRLTMTAVAALTLAAAAPAVADATVEGSLMELIDNPVICASPDPADIPGAPVAEMVMVDGFGTGGFAVDTANPEAQAWFNHGVRLRWAFEHTESVRAFQRARLIDPTCGMCAWGEAWAMGPNLNGGGTGEETRRAALAIAREARRLASRDASRTQVRMIDALIQRYSGFEFSRARRYAHYMDRIARDNPADVTIAAVTADAWMMQADEWWDDEGRAADAGITRAVNLLEAALAQAPDDPGAIHLYIHLTEWSDDPHRAIPYGERLAALAPGASHLVHMPSHTFYRVGRYRDAMMSNVNAVALDARYVEMASPPGGIRGVRLHGHNIHFGMGGALMAGGAEDGLRLAERFLTLYADQPRLDTAWGQAMANNAYALYGRYGSDDQLAALAEPPESRPLQRIGWRYARGEAAARRGDAEAVAREAAEIARLREALPEGDDRQFTDGFSEVFQKVLEGRAAMIRRDWPAAIAAYGRAAELHGQGEEGGDPPIIWYPTRRSLAAAMLASGDAAGARDKVLELLEDWPSDPYSYFVLAEAYDALGDPAAAARARAAGSVEWIGGDMSLGLA